MSPRPNNPKYCIIVLLVTWCCWWSTMTDAYRIPQPYNPWTRPNVGLDYNDVSLYDYYYGAPRRQPPFPGNDFYYGATQRQPPFLGNDFYYGAPRRHPYFGYVQSSTQDGYPTDGYSNRMSINNALRTIADSYLYEQHKLREWQEENLRRRFMELDVCRRSVDVAIVGGGPAGAYSAYRLRNEKLKIEVFEFSDRIGGRLFTSFLKNAPDLPLELGGMRYIPDVHTRVQELVDAFGLTRQVFSEKHGSYSNARFYLRGQSLTTDQVVSGDVPFKFSPEEKANQGRLFRYYLEKLTGYNGTEVTQEILMKLKVADGRYLYTIPVNEALDMVATPDGKEFLKAIDLFESDGAADTASLSLMENNLGPYAGDYVVYQLKEGMSSVPQGMINAFLRASTSHSLSLNRRLVSITRNKAGDYVLSFQQTQTKDGVTNDKNSRDTVCAGKVILAIPQFALKDVRWNPLRDERVNEAINAVRPVVGGKVFMSFSEPWWLTSASTNAAPITYSDLTFSQFYDWGRSNSSGEYVMLASYSDETKAQYLDYLNYQGKVFSGSPNTVNRVSVTLKNNILDQLSKVFGIDRKSIPEPLSAVSMFWKGYPFGGSWSLWKFGYRYDDVISTVQRPSLTDDVFLVGADHSRGYHVGWSEGAYETVDRVLDLYFF